MPNIIVFKILDEIGFLKFSVLNVTCDGNALISYKLINQTNPNQKITKNLKKWHTHRDPIEEEDDKGV